MRKREYISLTQARELLQVDGHPAFSRSTWYQMAQEKRLPVVKLGAKYLVPVDQFKDWVSTGEWSGVRR